MPTPQAGVSISELALQHMLLACASIPGVTEVSRAREDLYSEREANSINIKGEDEQTRPMGDQVDDSELTATLDVYVRAEQTQVWETLADAIAVKAHARLTAYTAWPIGVTKIRKIGKRFGGYAAELTPGVLSVKYAIRLVNMAGALDEAP